MCYDDLEGAGMLYLYSEGPQIRIPWSSWVANRDGNASYGGVARLGGICLSKPEDGVSQVVVRE